MKKTILVTGGLGYIGKHIVFKLKKDYNIIIIDDLSNSTTKIIDILSCNTIKLYQKSILDKLDDVFTQQKILIYTIKLMFRAQKIW